MEVATVVVLNVGMEPTAVTLGILFAVYDKEAAVPAVTLTLSPVPKLPSIIVNTPFA